MRRSAVAAVVVLVLAGGFHVWAQEDEPGTVRDAQRLRLASQSVEVRLKRTEIGPHDRLVASIVNRRTTGVRGKRITNYTLAGRAVRPAVACVNNRDRQFPYAPQGERVRAKLDPARGEGGPEGWCPGRYRGTVTYFSGFACPPSGTCHPPKGFPTRQRVVARFSFRVRAAG